MSASSSQRFVAPLVKLTIFAVVTTVLTAMLASTIANLSFSGRTEYRAQFTDVTGMVEGDDVRIAGVKVGEVEDIRVVRNRIAEVTFSVYDGTPVATSTRVRVRYRNIVGTRYVALTEGPGDGRPLPENGLIPLSQTQPALDLTVLFNGFKPLFAALNPKDVNTFAYEIVRVLQGEGGTVNSLLARTASLTNTLADRDQLIGRVIDNLNAVLLTLATRDQQLSQLILQLQRFTSGLAADREAIGASLANISALAVSTASLLTEARPALKADIAALGQVATTLNASSAVVDNVLKRLPTKYRMVTATAKDGSWFNFYLCQGSGRITVPDPAGGPPITVDAVAIQQTGGRCAQ